MEWESIVNQHSGDKKATEHRTRRKKYLRKVVVSAAVSFAFLIATVFNLVAPVLGLSVEVLFLMIGSYNLGRAKESNQ